MKKRPINLDDISRLQEWIILCLYQKELYGGQIPKHIEKASNNTRRVGCGSLYPALDDLERKGLIQSKWGEQRLAERKNARRKYYTLTSEGERIAHEIDDFSHQLKVINLPLDTI
jgi:PadR family transcriptional regulator, regulatory protein PadR